MQGLDPPKINAWRIRTDTRACTCTLRLAFDDPNRLPSLAALTRIDMPCVSSARYRYVDMDRHTLLRGLLQVFDRLSVSQPGLESLCAAAAAVLPQTGSCSIAFLSYRV